jgi:hypothetical protein
MGVRTGGGHRWTGREHRRCARPRVGRVPARSRAARAAQDASAQDDRRLTPHRRLAPVASVTDQPREVAAGGTRSPSVAVVEPAHPVHALLDESELAGRAPPARPPSSPRAAAGRACSPTIAQVGRVAVPRMEAPERRPGPQYTPGWTVVADSAAPARRPPVGTSRSVDDPARPSHARSARCRATCRTDADGPTGRADPRRCGQADGDRTVLVATAPPMPARMRSGSPVDVSGSSPP